MKKILLLSSLFVGSLTLAQAQSGTLLTEYIGGGTDFYEVTEENLSIHAYNVNTASGTAITIKASGEEKYAGIDGKAIGLTATKIDGVKQVATAVYTYTDWIIKNQFIVSSTCDHYNNGARTYFYVKDGAKLTLSNLVAISPNTNSNFLNFEGQNSENNTLLGKVVLNISHSDSGTLVANNLGNTAIRFKNIEASFTNETVKVNQLHLEGDAVLSLQQDFLVSSVMYGKKANTIKLNGNEFSVKNNNFAGEGQTTTLTIDYSNGVGTFLGKSLSTSETTKVYLEIINYNNDEGDMLIFTSSSVAKDNIKFIAQDGTEYTGSDIEVENLGSGQYRYYVEGLIPEPSTYAAIFGVIALTFALYRRRK